MPLSARAEARLAADCERLRRQRLDERQPTEEPTSPREQDTEVELALESLVHSAT
jgi:hypothetical protein